MKRMMAVVVVLFVSMVSHVHAQQRGFGLGAILGEPTGLSAKLWTSERTAFDAGLAYSFRREGHIHIHADYLWHFSHVVPGPGRFVPFIGLGGRLSGGKKSGVLGVRFVGGLGWYPRDSPLEVFVEVAPILDVVPATEFSANGGLGLRFYF